MLLISSGIAEEKWLKSSGVAETFKKKKRNKGKIWKT